MTLATIVSGVTGWDGRAGLLRAAGRCYRLGRHGDLRLFLLVLLGHGIFLSFWHVLCRVMIAVQKAGRVVISGTRR